MARAGRRPPTTSIEVVARPRRPLHPPLVHRHPRPAEELLDQRRRARGRVRGRHGLRRLLDHRLQPDRGVGHDRDARPVDLRDPALAARRRRRRRAHVLRRPGARAASPTRATRAGSCAGRWSAPRRWASTPSTSAPSSSTSTSARQARGRRARGARRGRLLRPDHARRRLRRAPRDGARARAARASTSSTPTTRSAPPSTRSTCATRTRSKMADDCMTYRITVKEYAMKYGWHATFMPKPLFGENGSGMHVHQSLFKDGTQRLLRRRRPVLPLRRRRRRSSPASSRHAREISPLFAQWVNSYKRLVPGYEAPVYLAWSRRNRSALIRVPLYHPGKEQATRAGAALPRPRLQPVPVLRGDAARRASRGSRRATSCPSRWSRTSTT